ncbi:IPT/TIG domain-containing protein [Ancylobacter sp. IITR112]|uniref:IPT/TIG domain-containing protein n=1 Tax=Ancylobacter sp. IITR112 TaxID=3138073 RepID=UPI00352AD21B
MEPYIGAVSMFPMPPGTGWFPCDGRQLSIQRYPALYAVIGTTYGGDGKLTFNIPDLRGRAVIGAGADKDIALGHAGGTEMVVLSAGQLPQHTHKVRFSPNDGTGQSGKGRLPARSMPDKDGVSAKLYAEVQSNSVTTALAPETVVPTGSSAPHNNLQPSFVIGYYIAHVGLFPPRQPDGEAPVDPPSPDGAAPRPGTARPKGSTVAAFTGEIRILAGLPTQTPNGWVLCDGAELKISDQQVLYSLIGNMFGGKAPSTFRVPDLRGRITVGLGNGPGLTPRHTIGQTFGDATVQLGPGQMPAHTHAFNVLKQEATLTTPKPGVMYAASPDCLFYQAPTTAATTQVSFDARTVSVPDKESGMHNNLMPSVAMYYMICLNGLYPPLEEVPRLNGISPNSGPPVPPVPPVPPALPGGEEGPLQITLNGMNLTQPGTSSVVTFGSVKATIVSANENALVVQCPPGNGTVTVTVTTSKGVTEPNWGCQFSYVPSVTALYPAVGSSAGGGRVTIKGVGFAGATSVMFGQLPANGFQVVDGETIFATAPAQSDGIASVNVTVTTSGQTSAVTSACVFTITSLFIEVNPGYGPAAGGNTVTLTGTNFDLESTNYVVWFGDVKASSWTVVNTTTITAVAPAGVGQVEVSVESLLSGTRSPAVRYVYAAIVSQFSPTYGPSTGGTAVSISGVNFDPASKVLFGTTSVTPTRTTSTSIAVTSPPGTGVAALSVTGPGGPSISAGSLPLYSYLPQLDRLYPSVGQPDGDSSVTLYGRNFTADATVRFGDQMVAASDITDTSLVVTAPTGIGGAAYEVAVITGGGTSGPRPYTYCTVGIAGLEPAAGPAGTSVTITGVGFGAAPSVLFGTVAAANVSVNSSGTEIVCVAPAGIAGAVNVSVRAGGAVSPANDASRYSFAPVVHALSRDTGKPLTQVTLTGEGFVAQPATGSQMRVSFGALSATQIGVSTATSVTVAAPVNLGRVPVVVHTPGGQSNEMIFTYVPAVLSITPSFGTQGAVVRLVGAGLSEDGAPVVPLSVTFGAAASPAFWSGGSQSVWAQVPAGKGTVPVILKTAAGSTGTWSGALFYYAPVVTSVSPGGGPAAGGTTVTIRGSGFTGATAVLFNLDKGLGLNVISDTELSVTTPPGLGKAEVSVQLPHAASGPHVGSSFIFGPTIDGIDPPSLSISQSDRVFIYGEGLGDIVSIDFGGVIYRSSSQGVWWTHDSMDPTRALTVMLTPEGHVAGTSQVTITTIYGTSPPVNFTWTS